MNGVRLDGRAYCYDKSAPGCLGRVANLFDLTSGVARNRLLTDKPHRDGSPLSRSRSDISRMSSPVSEETEDKMIVSEMTNSSSTKRTDGTPMKMLIAQEMSKDLESKSNSPNLVAKLMGLDALPQQPQHRPPDLAHGRINSRCHLRSSYSEIPHGYWQQEDGFVDREVNCDTHRNYKDIYEIWQSSPKGNCQRDASPQKGRTNENNDDKRMALIRQKFMDAKRLSTDEKLRQTKEFQEALDVLSSNQDLFLRVLQEPNSLISHHLNGGQSVPVPQETKRITVLRPSKMVFNDKFPASGNRSEKQVKKPTQGNQANGWSNHHCGFSPVVSNFRVDESPSQPTRIVVLKPSPGRISDMAAAVPSTPPSPRNLRQTTFFEEQGDIETQEAREVAKEITQQMRNNLAGHRRDETLLSSVFSNGYTGDESSFHRSEAEFVGNLSDTEVMSPASRHSWDYVNRYGSPYSCSSLSRASCSPESSVAREAKKRLSERWALMSSNGTAAERRYMRRSSSTLGEMLALFDAKKPDLFEVNPKRDQDSRASTSRLTGNSEEGEAESPRNLLRSKSLPVSYSSSAQRIDAEALVPPKQTSKSSFRGKVSSLFFPRSRKPSKERAVKPQSPDQALPNHAESSVHFGSEEIQSPDLQSVNRTLFAELNDKSRQGPSSQQAALRENQDQPSPISVLEPPFEEDGSSIVGFSDAIGPEQLGKQMSFFGKSNLIDKSPPIGSIARTLSWDEPHAQPATSDLLTTPYLPPPGGPEEEAEWLSLVQSLLSAADVASECQLSTNLKRWHSPESPLDPSLRDKYIDLSSKQTHLTSNRLLVFDSVNSALVDLTGLGSSTSQWVNNTTNQTKGGSLANRVVARMKEWRWSGSEAEAEDDGDDCRDGNSLVAELAVRRELVGRWWSDQTRLEVDMVGREIEGRLLEELVEESIGEWTGKDLCL